MSRVDGSVKTESELDKLPPSHVPPTARTIEPFLRLKLGTTRRDVIAQVGMPDEDVGSGLYVEIYKLSDGSTVTLGSNGQLLYMMYRQFYGLLLVGFCGFTALFALFLILLTRWATT